MLGLVLEGGGARGAFQMGAVKALFDEGYRFEGVAGTSIGALNGAIIAQGDFELGYEWWGRMETSLLFDIEQTQLQKLTNRKIDKEGLLYLSAKVKDIIENRGLDTRKIRATLESVINEEKLRESSLDFGIVTVSLSDLKPLELYKEDIPAGKMISYLMASANFPVFKIEPIEGKLYIDGGFYDNCPINLLTRKGYEEIIAIRTFGIGIVRKVEDPNVKITYIVPSGDLGGILNFDSDLIRTNLKMGYCDAMRMIKGLKGKKYYIEPVVDENLFYHSLLSVSEAAIYEVGKIMILPQMEPKRMLFEKILPGLAHMLGLPTTSTYQDIVIGVLEFMAEDRGMEKYTIRTLKGFIEEINNIDTNKKIIASSFISEIAGRTILSSVFAKDLVLKKIGEEILKIVKEEQFF